MTILYGIMVQVSGTAACRMNEKNKLFVLKVEKGNNTATEHMTGSRSLFFESFVQFEERKKDLVAGDWKQINRLTNCFPQYDKYDK